MKPAHARTATARDLQADRIVCTTEADRVSSRTPRGRRRCNTHRVKQDPSVSPKSRSARCADAPASQRRALPREPLPRDASVISVIDDLQRDRALQEDMPRL